MNESQYVYWMWTIMLLNTPPYAIACWLFLRWRRMAIRRWVRRAFLFAAAMSAGFVLFRLASFVFADSLSLRLFSSVYFVTGSYMIIGMFAIATQMTERRVAKHQKELQAALGPQKTSDMLGAVITELKELDKYRIAKV